MPDGPGPPARSVRQGPTARFWLLIGAAALVLGGYLFNAGLLGGKAAGSAPLSASARPPAPDLKVADAAHPADLLALRALRGKVVVLHFWATWCPPCRAEFPEFAKFAASSDSAVPWVVVPVSIDDAPGVVGPFLAKVPGRFKVFWDPGKLADALQISAVPTTVLLDKEGRVAWQRTGAADWSPAGVPSVVRELSRE